MTSASTAVTLDQLAAELDEARRSRRPVAPLRSRGRELTVQDAYAIQQINSNRRLAAGARLAGHKIGLTSEAMQRQLGVAEPDFGILLDDMVLAGGSVVAVGDLIAPRIEAEIAVTFGHEVRGPGLGVAEIADAIASVVPALEVIDSRVANWDISLVDTVADNASSALAVGGSPVEGMDPYRLADESVELLVDGAVVAQGTGKALLGDPLLALAWLANRLGEYGEAISPGTIVLAGSVHASIPLVGGSLYTARYSSVGSVSVRAVA
jgi:2-keto-4-pentenoate hydratase